MTAQTSNVPLPLAGKAMRVAMVTGNQWPYEKSGEEKGDDSRTNVLQYHW